MSLTVESLGIDKLSIEERLQLIDLIWDSLPQSFEPTEIPEWHIAELEKRRAAVDAQPGVGILWRGMIPGLRDNTTCDRINVPSEPLGGKIVPETKRTLDELAKLGGEIFDQQIRPMLRTEDHGKFVAIDVETGAYEVDEDDYTAVARLRSRNPEADVWLMRAGYPTAYRIGAIR